MFPWAKETSQARELRLACSGDSDQRFLTAIPHQDLASAASALAPHTLRTQALITSACNTSPLLSWLAGQYIGSVQNNRAFDESFQRPKRAGFSCGGTKHARIRLQRCESFRRHGLECDCGGIRCVDATVGLQGLCSPWRRPVSLRASPPGAK